MFRIQPGIADEPIQRSFENAKFALNTALLVDRWDLPVDSVIALHEFSSVVRIPYFLRTDSIETTRMWERGSLSVEFSCIAQGQGFTGHVMGAVIGAAPVPLINVVCAVPAGAKLYQSFTGYLPSVDWRPYDGVVVAVEVPVAPVAADRYVITTQLTFRPFAPFATP